MAQNNPIEPYHQFLVGPQTDQFVSPHPDDLRTLVQMGRVEIRDEAAMLID
jgi:hypothetical protein